MVDVVVVILYQSSIIQKVTRTAKNSQVPFTDRIVDVLVVIQRQVPTFQKTAVQRQASRGDTTPVP